MIGLPFNDFRCLSSITDVIVELVENEDAVLTELAAAHPTTESLAEYIRGLPQRDDFGDKQDGPRIDKCEPPQRLRIPADDPNCVERSSLYIAAAEFIDANPMRQLATLDTPIGMHTFPVENGSPVILDSRVTRNCLECGVQFLTQSPVVVDARDAIDWTTQLAEAGAADTRNGLSRLRLARNAIASLVEEGAAPARADEVDAIAWLLSIAERMARRYGPRAIAVVRTTAQAIAELADEAIARSTRNLSLEIGGRWLSPAPWMSALGRIAGRVGLNVGAAALESQLTRLGIGKDMLGVVENELNREGYTLGAVVNPPKLPTLEKFVKRST